MTLTVLPDRSDGAARRISEHARLFVPCVNVDQRRTLLESIVASRSCCGPTGKADAGHLNRFAHSGKQMALRPSTFITRADYTRRYKREKGGGQGE